MTIDMPGLANIRQWIVVRAVSAARNPVSPTVHGIIADNINRI